ncbi:MAG: HepT-like ribonuclease domain-containing protein [Bacteroidota bacterium]
MTGRAKKYLSDILYAIGLINEFLTDITDAEAYFQDLKTQSAIERQLGIIGEAVNQFRKQETEITLSHDKEIVQFRNRLIHAYSSIDDGIVWSILVDYLPQLQTEVEALLNPP